ncbi:uncharacterized protein [Palaemon carinicauda]|uniref:uncharacterized protein n=1 Tax=Palaemon carinicauda TaxID=392227 RepID=UPI0035B5BE27
MNTRKIVGQEEITSIIDLYKAGISVRRICEQKQLSKRTVYRWIHRYEEGDADAIPVPKPKSGRPKKIKPATLRLIHRQLKQDPSLTAREIKDKNSRLLGEVSLRTVQQRIHDDLLCSYKACEKPLLTAVQKQKRVVFAKKYSAWDPIKWRDVLWTDEATFNVTGSGAKRVYRPSGSDPHLPQYTSKTVKHPASVMVWGSFGYGGVGELFFLPKNEHMNQFNYFNLLNDHLEQGFSTFLAHAPLSPFIQFIQLPKYINQIRKTHDQFLITQPAGNSVLPCTSKHNLSSYLSSNTRSVIFPLDSQRTFVGK